MVTDTFQTTAYRTWTVQIRDDETGELETVTTTDEHPFYVDGQGWTAAPDLAEGAVLTNPDGTTATVVSLETTLHGEGLTVYNFAVDTTHTYFVADDQGDVNAVWVHNSYTAPRKIKGKVVGPFSVFNWKGYPKGVPKSKGPLTVISGKIYKISRKAASNVNRRVRRTLGLVGGAVHEIQPVKFGGDPVDWRNKLIVDTVTHIKLNIFWTRFLSRL